MEQPINIFRPCTLPNILKLLTVSFIAMPLPAAVIVQSVFVDDEFYDQLYDGFDAYDPGAGASGPLSIIPGIDKFDPALGTLNQILIKPGSSLGSAPQLAYASDADITTNTDGPFEFELSPPFAADGGIYYLPSDSNSLFSVSVNEFFFDILYQDTAPTADNYFLYLQGDGPIDLPQSTNLMDLPGFFADDFVGAGQVSTLEFGLFLPQSVEFLQVSDSIDSLSVSMQLQLYSGYMEVEYHYTPVPEPRASAFIAALAALWLCRRRALRRSIPERN
jgi:hypothetical protein